MRVGVSLVGVCVWMEMALGLGRMNTCLKYCQVLVDEENYSSSHLASILIDRCQVVICLGVGVCD